jgi:hypothetical protein
MQAVSTQSLGTYVGKLKWFEAFIIGYPVIAGLIPEKSVYLAPPLGNLSDLISPLAFLLVGISAILPWFIKRRHHAVIIAILSILCSTATLVFYSNSVNASVIRLEGFNPHAIARVSVGSERTDFANENFRGKSNIEMVKEYGHKEEDIQKLFTEDSIYHQRSKLLYSYIGFFVALNIAIGSFVRNDMLQTRE